MKYISKISAICIIAAVAVIVALGFLNAEIVEYTRGHYNLFTIIPILFF